MRGQVISYSALWCIEICGVQVIIIQRIHVYSQVNIRMVGKLVMSLFSQVVYAVKLLILLMLYKIKIKSSHTFF